jgi:hypothetical protein
LWGEAVPPNYFVVVVIIFAREIIRFRSAISGYLHFHILCLDQQSHENRQNRYSVHAPFASYGWDAQPSTDCAAGRAELLHDDLSQRH